MRTFQVPLRALLMIAASALLVTTAGPGQAGDQREARYEGAGAQVIRVAGVTVRDEGSMTCSASTGAGIGGSCLRFDPTVPAPAIFAVDSVLGTQMAYQACIDNNGDSFCTSPEEGPCADDIIFSHADGGAFFNPLKVPGGFRPGCPGGPFPGYIVFVCEGTHVDATGPHTHSPTTGVTSLVSGGTGTGNFCGGTQQNVSRKRYTINP